MADVTTGSLAPSEEKYGPSPFDSTSIGDCVIRCSDDFLLKTSRTVLSLASPVFKDMFGMPQGDANTLALEPILITEPSTVFHPLLLLLYPSLTPCLNTADEVFALLEAYDKYDIAIQPFRPILMEFLRRPNFVMSHEAHYAIAWVAGLKDEAQKAARHLHKTDLKDTKLKSDMFRRTKDPQAHAALLELRLQRQTDLHAFIERLPFEMYFCDLHSPKLADVGKIRNLVNSEMDTIAPDAIRLLKALSSHFLSAAKRPIIGLPAYITLPAPTSGPFSFGQPTVLPHPKGNVAVAPSRRTCLCDGCSTTQVVPKTEEQIYEVIQKVALAMQMFPQTIEWPKGKAAF